MNIDMSFAFMEVYDAVMVRLAPALRDKIQQRYNYPLQIHVENIGPSINVIIADGQRWLAEFAVMVDDQGQPYWMPVRRVL